jgi:peptidoglycan L-alanyl-D-glutamate endopeptidase CwlK
MPVFGQRSLGNIANCHSELVSVAHEAIKHIDFTVICGKRGRAEQEAAFASGASRAHFGQSPHNFLPSLAFDFIPYPFVDADWERNDKFAAVAAEIKLAAKRLGYVIEWGGDWHGFKDMPHIQLADWRIRSEKS